MKPSLDRVLKIFKLEGEQNYENRAVIGGLERMLERWSADARADSVPEDLIQVVLGRMRDYGRLSPTGRADVLDGLARRIQREAGVSESGVNITPKPQPPRPAPRRGEPSQSPSGRSREGGDPASSHPRTPPETISSQRQENRAAASPQPAEGSSASGEAEEHLTFDAPEEVDLPVAAGDHPIAPGPSLSDSAARFIPPGAPPTEPAALDAPVTVLPGIGPRHGQTLARLGILTLRDLLYYFPRRYDDYSRLTPINRLFYSQEVTVIAAVQSITARPRRGGASSIVEAVVSDGSGALRVTWFNPYIARRIRAGDAVVLSGKIEQYLGRLTMNNPEVDLLDSQQISTNRIVPVYPLTAQITQRWLRKVMFAVVAYWAPRVQDPLPLALRRQAGLMDLPNALIQAHFPDSPEQLSAARQRLGFDEIFLLQLGVLGQKRQWQARPARVFDATDEWLESRMAGLPFPLTGAQRRSIGEIRRDLASGRPMNRLLQGDVGSGKTIVAATAISIIVQNGAQAALMAPTGILAEQHYKSLLRLLAGVLPPAEPQPEPPAPPRPAPVLRRRLTAAQMLAGEGIAETEVAEAEPAEAEIKPAPEAIQPPTEAAPPEAAAPPEPQPPVLTIPPALPLLAAQAIRLLVGATPEAEKREIRAGLSDGSIQIVIGTHALLEDPIQFKDLELTVVDEQHRFGVEQRAILRAKGRNPHLLVMTATPIPRSLALTVYGDLDLSVMDEMPPGRQPVETHVLPPREIERAYALIRAQVEAGRQAFVIYPLVEESEKSEAKAAVAEQARLQTEIFPKLKVGLLHGRMKPEDKDEVMERFRSRQVQVLVSTSVIEVGVDVPNATVMLIEGANRFGLAQLHQFRGRVGRGGDKSYCLLVPDTLDALENERLQVMAETNDGFVLAEKDLQQRGPGQFLGTRQSGFNELQLANLTDVRLIEKARRFAAALFERDPDLTQPEHGLIGPALERFWGSVRSDIS
jgi:ATP-dependent DNA helicase RecG